MGRGEDGHFLRAMDSSSNLLNIGDPYVMDIRGDLKPELTPARMPSISRWEVQTDKSWGPVVEQTTLAHAKLWESVLNAYGGREHAKAFWQLAALHKVPISKVDARLLWDILPIPSLDPAGKFVFRFFDELRRIPLGVSSQDHFLAEQDGFHINYDGKVYGGLCIAAA